MRSAYVVDVKTGSFEVVGVCATFWVYVTLPAARPPDPVFSIITFLITILCPSLSLLLLLTHRRLLFPYHLFVVAFSVEGPDEIGFLPYRPFLSSLSFSVTLYWHFCPQQSVLSTILIASHT